MIENPLLRSATEVALLAHIEAVLSDPPVGILDSPDRLFNWRGALQEKWRRIYQPSGVLEGVGATKFTDKLHELDKSLLQKAVDNVAKRSTANIPEEDTGINDIKRLMIRDTAQEWVRPAIVFPEHQGQKSDTAWAEDIDNWVDNQFHRSRHDIPARSHAALENLKGAVSAMREEEIRTGLGRKLRRWSKRQLPGMRDGIDQAEVSQLDYIARADNLGLAMDMIVQDVISPDKVLEMKRFIRQEKPASGTGHDVSYRKENPILVAKDFIARHVSGAIDDLDAYQQRERGVSRVLAAVILAFDSMSSKRAVPGPARQRKRETLPARPKVSPASPEKLKPIDPAVFADLATSEVIRIADALRGWPDKVESELDDMRAAGLEAQVSQLNEFASRLPGLFTATEVLRSRFPDIIRSVQARGSVETILPELKPALSEVIAGLQYLAKPILEVRGIIGFNRFPEYDRYPVLNDLVEVLGTNIFLLFRDLSSLPELKSEMDAVHKLKNQLFPNKKKKKKKADDDEENDEVDDEPDAEE